MIKEKHTNTKLPANTCKVPKLQALGEIKNNIRVFVCIRRNKRGPIKTLLSDSLLWIPLNSLLRLLP